MFRIQVNTPNIDELAAEGIRYTNFRKPDVFAHSGFTMRAQFPYSGMGHVAHFTDLGFGYAMELREMQ